MTGGRTVVATANILCSLPAAAAREALHVVLAAEPDLVGLQEWGPKRRRLLAETAGYLWAAPLVGGCPVGVRADRYDVLTGRARWLAGPGWCDPGVRPVPLLPARIATLAVLRDRETGRTVSLLSFHLTPGVQRRGSYRADRPRLAARHRQEVIALRRLVAGQLALGHVVHAVGDSNFDGLALPPLTSAWLGREDGPGTLGSARKIDDVHGPGRAASVVLLETPSDHKAVVVTRPDPA
ncbi:hypothetical protein KRR39_04690 [Nocardioides panacis]|uniref:Endonuclease/exonuclease/phosphatase domain-containing protein n=1 Tax=Nocardioides panacis TaxID=2849501 RepID=A0A975Y139_9ACTN|nr:hypothetical protein [Nocardioides panacis]QWZ09112.1 hypothetical protein KRR39_04690 [Nocardioides panacis]